MRGNPRLRRIGDLAGRVMAARFPVVSMARGFTWRSYSRQVSARMRCDPFCHLVAETAAESAPVQMMHW